MVPAPRIPAASSSGGAPACCGGGAPSSASASSSSVLVTARGATYSLDLAYWLGIRASVAAKQPLTLKTVVQVIRSLDGRDKITKTIQYSCRFLWWYYSQQADPFSKETGKRFETVRLTDVYRAESVMSPCSFASTNARTTSAYTQMFRASQTARKCFHLFRSLEELEKIQALMQDRVRKIHACLGGWMDDGTIRSNDWWGS